ncbi:lon protease homolog 2, peroxisomal-like isoform X1 [Gossypium arboreum]|uniref:lon protease homolog 2, peroxisomal-like isoform X1 n=2 Tax=Gossypium arboreum TaxID=29729 RepID=UPI0008196FC5|nr:lon protease homolog 2, peroxisomal-like isoform X1 [Gossypium arboreum]XP_017619794.1 lon protease homolog 2, peroxisomal-like isoform X1 [Gossypium arboreum]XP_017619795.1 lon protease homolog 2, peroxisomal-like isoform X1 [Gossypium arboreum]XP_052877922.1 lon protease homolog 2, peroxisomal-like isoform X1 [Gossypium arboreum]
MAESVELPGRLAILPFRNKVLLPGAFIRIRCTSQSSVKLVEQELWQREEKGLIGILPVQDAAETTSMDSMLSQGVGSESCERSSNAQVSTSDAHKVDGKNPSEVIHWHNRGVAARALHLSRGVEKPSGRVTYIVVLEGLCRFNIEELNTRGPYCTAKISPLEMTKSGYFLISIFYLLTCSEMEQVEQDPDFVTLSRQFKAIAMELISILEQKQKTGGRIKVLLETLPFHKLADIFVASFEISFEEQLCMLDSVDPKVRLSKATELVDRHLQSIRVAEKITQKVEGQLSKSQKEYLLRQQMRAIKEELGDNDDDEDDLASLERKMQNAGMPSNIWKHAQRELRRLKKMQPQQPGYNSSRVYLDLLADLPWQKASEEQEMDLKAAKDHLDCDHYGLVKIKQRIIEYLAVRKLKPDARGPVLCFVGPPGVGKTSLASSIAAALGRKFIRISLGGVKDEADIRGHRRTYIGSMPGRLIDGLKRVGVCNPVMLLDEIDKTGSDVRGDPASALLEVLDPEQNKSFNDHYLNVPFDLSKVIFVATANRMQPIPPPLLDRMEVIELPGYIAEEKLRIAMQHLIPRVLDQHGLSSAFLQIPEDMVKLVIQRYTREAGVRNLERNLAALARAAAVRVAEREQAVSVSKDVHKITSPLLDSRLAEGAEMEMEVIPIGVNNHEISNAFRIASPLVVDEAMLEKILGPPRFDDREAADRVATPGVSVGLVWTAFGGEVQFVEATSVVGNGELHLTGQLGDVIKESAQIALTWVRARVADLKLAAAEETDLLQGKDIHIHFPAGAVPKDGPSAGVTLVTALVSLFSQKNVRADTAMTGEMTLRGLVLPVGGVKDKVLAAHRYGIKRVILPERNLKDLVEVPAAVLSSLEILVAKRMEDVLEHAFDGGCPWRQHQHSKL